MRREHARWGAKQIRLELLRKPPEYFVGPVPSVSTVNRILRPHQLLKERPRKRPRDSYIRFERSAPMQLCGIDIVGGITLVNSFTGELREAKIFTGVDKRRGSHIAPLHRPKQGHRRGPDPQAAGRA